MMTRDCGRSHRSAISRSALLAVFIGLLLISAETFTPSIALAKNVAAQSVAMFEPQLRPHQFPPWRVAPAHGILLKELN